MKQFVTLFIIALLSALNIDAQSYTDHVQTKEQGQGTVTINQSKEIDELVNGKNNTQQAIHANKPTSNKQATTEQHKATEKKAEVKPTHTEQHSTIKENKDSAKKEEAVKHDTPPTKTDNSTEEDNEMDIPVVDMRKKVMRQSYKVTGYRVQAFAGGNSRNDKVKARQIGNNIKMQFPDEPVYVHFYSPRWICRVGNYRSYEEASRMLHKIKSMGYKSASIVRGKITVQY